MPLKCVVSNQAQTVNYIPLYPKLLGDLIRLMYVHLTTYFWCNSLFISMSFCEVADARVGIQVSRRKFYIHIHLDYIFLFIFYLFLASFNLWCLFLMIALYHQTKTPISFWCRRKLNPRSLIQLLETLQVELTGTHRLC